MTEEWKENIKRSNRIKNSKKIDQYSLEGEFIKTYSSAQEAAKKYKTDRSNIIKVARGKRKKHRNYIWKYA